MKQLSLIALALLLAGSFAIAGQSKEAKKNNDKFTMKGVPTAKQVVAAEKKASYRTDSVVKTEIAGGKGHATFTPADLKHFEESEVAKGAIMGKLKIDHDSNEIEAGTYVVYACKDAGVWRIFYCEKGEATAQSGTVKASEHNTHDPEFDKNGHFINYAWITWSW